MGKKRHRTIHPRRPKIMTENFISLVFAFAHHENKKIIGDGKDLPWDHLPEDLRNFKKLTMGRAVIMGRKTWDSLPRKPLPDRINIIISRQKNLSVPNNVAIFDDIKKALSHCGHQAGVIGGAEIFNLAYPFANVIFATELQGAGILPSRLDSPCYLAVDCEKDFKEVERLDFPSATIPFIVREYHRHGYNAAPSLKKLLA